jgi:hypothetical protein
MRLFPNPRCPSAQIGLQLDQDLNPPRYSDLFPDESDVEGRYWHALQTVPVVGAVEHDLSLILGMAASLATCGSVTALTVFYRAKRMRA